MGIPATDAQIAEYERLALERGGTVSGGGTIAPPEPAPGISEDLFTTLVIQLAQSLGYLAVHFRPGMNRRGQWATQGRGDSAGWPDVFMLRVSDGRIVVAELKVTTEPTPAQEKWLAAFRAADIEAFVWRPEDWKRIGEVLR